MPEIINSFRGKYSFLSNFYECKIKYKGLIFDNAESAFQAMKCEDAYQWKLFIGIDGNKAKRKGKLVKLRKDWDKVKDYFMYEIVEAKFNQNKDLKQKLLDTKNIILIEGNTWNDVYWGICKNIGQNKLGKILMRVREELRDLDA